MKQTLLLSFSLLLLTSTWAIGSTARYYQDQQQEKKQTPMQQNERQRLEDDYDDVNEEMNIEEGEQAESEVRKTLVATKKAENLNIYSRDSTVVDNSESAISFNFVYYIIQKFKLSELVSE